MWTISYIISQVIIFLAVFVTCISYVVRNRKIILIISLINTILFSLGYLFLHAYSAMAICLIGIIRSVWIYIDEEKGKEPSIVSLFTIMVISVLCGFFTLRTYVDLIPIMCSCVFVYSIWQKNICAYRFMALMHSLLWLLHDLLYMSILSIIGDAICIIFEIIGIVMWYKVDKYKIEALEKEKKDGKDV